MSKIILSINAGSSSVKVSVYSTSSRSQDPKQLAEAQIDGLTAPPPTLKYERGDKKIKGQKIGEKVESQEGAFRWILEHLEKDEGLPELKRKEDIGFACHRVVHGGDYSRPKVVNEDVYRHVEELSELAPLHNASSLSIIQAVAHLLPGARNIAYFDSAFHQTLPEHIRTYPIDPKIAARNKLRKYGFHGISYAFILRSVATYLNKAPSATSLIALHLGSGASACAIRAGRSVDTSMGLTPLAGLPGATRSGSVDPSLVFHYTHDAGRLAPHAAKDLHITAAEDILNKQSGWKALTGTTDFGVISAKATDEEDPQHRSCRLALDIFVDRVLGFVGAYYVALGGQCDALVFAGGIGEKGALLRKRVVDGVKCLGFELDDQKNNSPSDAVVSEIGYEGEKRSRNKVLIVKTDEQLEMARGVVQELVK